MKGALIFLADGFEDIEALATRDVLLRGGVPVQLVGIADDPFVVSAHSLAVGVDCMLGDFDNEPADSSEDIMIFPGGMPGAANLSGCKKLVSMMDEHYATGGTLAAICAAPGLVLSKLDKLPEGLEFTCYDGFQSALEERGAEFLAKPAVNCERIITGRGPGHTKAFALEILKALKGEAVAEKVRQGMEL